MNNFKLTAGEYVWRSAPNTAGEALRINLYYSKGRGIYASVTPILDHDGMESFVITAMRQVRVHPMTRMNAREFAKIAERVDPLIPEIALAAPAVGGYIPDVAWDRARSLLLQSQGQSPVPLT